MLICDFKVTRHACSTIRLAENALVAVVLIFCEIYIIKEFFG